MCIYVCVTYAHVWKFTPGLCTYRARGPSLISVPRPELKLMQPVVSWHRFSSVCSAYTVSQKGFLKSSASLFQNHWHFSLGNSLWWSCVHCAAFSNIPGFCSLMPGVSPQLLQSCLQTSPNGWVKVPEKTSWLKNWGALERVSFSLLSKQLTWSPNLNWEPCFFLSLSWKVSVEWVTVCNNTLAWDMNVFLSYCIPSSTV